MTDSKQAHADELHLASAEYALVVAPALAAAAETAAERGDPHLFNDMASMLALSWMVEGLVAAYQQAVPSSQWASEERAMQAAPLGACALVFTESELEPSVVEECLGALAQAGKMLKKDKVDQAAQGQLLEGWQALQQGDHESAIARLRECARSMAESVDEWESKRGANPA